MTDQIPENTQEQRSAKNSNLGPIVIMAVLVAFLAFLWFGLKRTYQGPVQVGHQLKDFTLQTFDGKTINTADQKGKVILINFWASWCVPCESEAAMLQQAWEYYQPGGRVVFMGLDYVDTEPEALASIAKYHSTYPNGPDLGTKISQQFRISGVPETYIVDTTGKVIHIEIGPFESLDDIKKIIDPLLK